MVFSNLAIAQKSWLIPTVRWLILPKNLPKSVVPQGKKKSPQMITITQDVLIFRETQSYQVDIVGL